MLLAFARFPFAATEMSAGNRAAATFDERRVRDAQPRDGLVGQLAERGANREHRAAEIHQNDRSGRSGSVPKRAEHTLAVGSKRPVRPASGRHDRHAWPCDLGDELRKAVRDRRAMGDEHQANEAVPGLPVHRGCILQCRTPFDNTHR